MANQLQKDKERPITMHGLIQNSGKIITTDNWFIAMHFGKT
jgi:hypothetical protein